MERDVSADGLEMCWFSVHQRGESFPAQPFNAQVGLFNTHTHTHTHTRTLANIQFYWAWSL